MGDPGVDGRIILRWIFFRGLGSAGTVLLSAEDGDTVVLRSTRHEVQIDVSFNHNRFKSISLDTESLFVFRRATSATSPTHL
jgi:hypothetical protein